MELSSLGYAITWYIYLFWLGIVFYPLVKLVLGRTFFDDGYAFSKIVSIVLLSYFTLVATQLFEFTRVFLFTSLFTFATLEYFLISKYFPKFKLLEKKSIKKIVGVEILFILSFAFWIFVRGQEPSIHGLEKFMDFGFMNSILRSKHLPPLDMWLSADPTHPKGYPINYYYFGHLTGAVLIKLSNIPSKFGYNLILATLFGLGITEVFSIVTTLIKNSFKKVSNFFVILFGLFGAFIANLGGNLHTIYVFTKGYDANNPLPFWKIFTLVPHPEKYWYPNATRFIYHTIHEFPAYSYVVADLHGHVFDIPIVLLTLALSYLLVFKLKLESYFLGAIFGFLIAIHYMTNAFDGPIYLLYFSFILLFIKGFNRKTFLGLITLIASFLVFSYPFSSHFSPFSNKIGLNCPPSFLSSIKHIGPLVFLSENCQISPLWMLLVLWGFFWFGFVTFLSLNIKKKKISEVALFVFSLFFVGTILIIIPEFFYAKDIYPGYFRANTMFKLGYQAFIMMSIATVYTIALVKKTKLKKIRWVIVKLIFSALTMLVVIYPYFAITSYYGKLNKKADLDGSKWMKTQHPAIKEIIEFVNHNIVGQPIIIEAQGDSYTDYNSVSAYTGLPTVAGWQVHEWLWRGSANVVGKRIPEIQTFYATSDPNVVLAMARKYHIKYIVVSPLEREKYPQLNEEKFSQVAYKIFTSSNGQASLYMIK